MSESLFSPQWYRVAPLRPRLRSHAQIHRHLYRGQVWYVLQDHASGRFHRYTPVANLVIGLMDGRRTLAEIWAIACERLGDDAPTQDDVLQLVGSLHRADVLVSGVAPDLQEQERRRRNLRQQRLKQYLLNPLGLRIPLFDPDRLLCWALPLVRPLFGWLGAIAWLLLVGSALVVVGVHWRALSQGVVDHVLSAENVVVIALVFPLLKLAHEFGHAFAVRRWGGEVHEMGIMLLVLMPIPYVDASAAAAFGSKASRMLVGAAGMAAELAIAALATLVWVNVEPGAVRAVAYNTMLLAGISALVFNGNPLLRFDAYYILSDLIEIPNLGQRSNAYLGYLVNRYAFGVRNLRSNVSAPGERSWFVVYGIASFCYRMLILAGILILVASKYLVAGVVLALWSSYAMLIQPLGKMVGHLASGAQLQAKRARAWVVSAAFLSLVAAVLVLVPVPSRTRAEGIVWAPEESVVRAGTDGFVVKVLARRGERVRKGEALIACDDPELAVRMRVLEAQLEELRARYDAAAASDRVQEQIVREEVGHVSARLAHARARVNEMLVRSPSDGVFIMVAPQNAAGRFLQRGDQLGHVMDYSTVTVRVVVPQGDADLVARATRNVEVRSVERVAQVLQASIRSAQPSATDRLPSLALSLAGGGQIGTDPTKQQDAKGSNEPRAVTPLFVYDLELAAGNQVWTLGHRVYVRFNHPAEPLAAQWYRGLRRLFLAKFSV